ncbi:aspartic protease [Rhizobium sp. Leaf384]|uniref:retropepsin-like aspartic protease family protein n=1 Tax=unclassified Rhizobium TaxID=2613769 RepID=UPI00071324A9|nr:MULTISPECIES: TIGR02281 family clan AA aspartic protease [unclassified Rhizobium]KQR68843.1 aspartic protease [Rhizobium sp. Leaf341]KQS79257.1 aspartic protease [Rhizobium sp. Leaf384]KQS82825.1 aspartic protease [Rhizobium sp. Leaf383]
MNRLTVALGILGLGLVLLLVNQGSGRTLGLDNDSFASLVGMTALLTVFAAGVWRSRNLSESVRQFALWVLIFLAVVTAYLYRGELEAYWARLSGGLMPGRAAVFTDNEGYQEVVLHKVMNGHFEANVAINGASVQMLVDTGASTVALSYADAKSLGLDPDSLAFTQRLMTANGEARGAPVTLAEVAIGPIVRTDVRATVAEDGKLDQSLLGMSFLSTLDMMQMKTDELRLRD